MNDQKVIFLMVRVSRMFPPNSKQVIGNISLGFYYGLAFKGDNQLRWLEGNWSDYEAGHRRRLGVAADAPRRVKYRSLTP